MKCFLIIVLILLFVRCKDCEDKGGFCNLLLNNSSSDTIIAFQEINHPDTIIRTLDSEKVAILTISPGRSKAIVGESNLHIWDNCNRCLDDVLTDAIGNGYIWVYVMTPLYLHSVGMDSFLRNPYPAILRRDSFSVEELRQKRFKLEYN